jgi:hypothetical protein
MCNLGQHDDRLSNKHEFYYGFLIRLKQKLLKTHSKEKLKTCLSYSLIEFVDEIEKAMNKFNTSGRNRKIEKSETMLINQIPDDDGFSINTKLSIIASKPSTISILLNDSSASLPQKIKKSKRRRFYIILIIVMLIIIGVFLALFFTVLNK